MSKPQRLLVPILLCCSSFSQVATQTKEHTFTVEQCRTDASQWAALPITKKDWSFEVLHLRAKEMFFCEMDYPQDPEQPHWVKLENQFFADEQDRYVHFLERHKLFNLFLEEDEKGER